MAVQALFAPRRDYGMDGRSPLCKEGISCEGWTERKRLAELLANEKAMGPILGFLKATDVGGREGAREREEEWGRKNDQVGEELLGD